MKKLFFPVVCFLLLAFISSSDGFIFVRAKSCSASNPAWSAEAQTGDSTWTSGNHGNPNYIVVAANAYTQDLAGCTQIRLLLRAGNSGTEIDSAAICQQGSGDAWDCETGTLDRITFDTGNNGTTIAADQDKYSDWITVSNLPMGNYAYLLKFYNDTNFSADYVDGGSTNSYRYDGGGDESQQEDVSAGSGSTIIWMSVEMETQ